MIKVYKTVENIVF